ncbi:hypothetical protein PUNSTDRAFT_115601 [Punctularia strigosozonata HHB-11173 SS5]|uniref:uncharacterized protein n=1 Tax=Punctularia strigosozonata (strain HHB-11173) TaxID=741275 RepID=UPI0004417C2C|nr:uncharacterized protein PUNSTDRAFT_115601 [Punctularia strigosozonata HHB-11173 SS5]EIN06324.1 hypothetical protein PUNSTDRAFT_115601 [Punctularia strigosozonata HHB-11173 SS5]
MSISVNVEDCFTAVRALATGLKELRERQANPIDAEFAIIGGVAIAALTRPVLNQYPSSVVNIQNVIKRQTEMNFEIKLPQNVNLSGLWAALKGVGYLPHGRDDLISAPGGVFDTSDAGNKYLLVRQYDAVGYSKNPKLPRTRKLDPVEFDISELDGSRLLDYMPKQDVFAAKSVVKLTLDTLPTSLPTFRPHVVLLLKIEGAAQREQNTQKDFVDIGILLALSDKLEPAELRFGRAAFDAFRTSEAWKQRIVPAVERWANKDKAKAEAVVNWLAENAAFRTGKELMWDEKLTQEQASKKIETIKAQAKAMWEGYFTQLKTLIV